MTKTFEKAVTGFNHNIKHKGRVYHVQTEDSGVNNPHIITHLFVGGNILATKKTSYADMVKAESLAELVREMMEEQHKEMLRNLVNGTYDNVDRSAQSYQPGQLASGQPAPLATEIAKAIPAAPVPSAPKKPAPIPLLAQAVLAPSVPPEVIAAQQLNEQPQENHVGIETLFGEDLISEKSLDEVILSYLSSDKNS